jgi:hypothetical protein
VLPAEGVLRAASRWLDLLGRASYSEAAALIRSEARYTDLSETQYNTALEWLIGLGAVEPAPTGYALPPGLAALRQDQRASVVFTRAVESASPAWLADSDVLVRTVADLPEDADRLSTVLGLSPSSALAGIRQVHGRIDLERRAEVGALGERLLVELLESRWPGSTTHIALEDDGFGYDVGFVDTEGADWHLEVKSTTRRGRLLVNLSRHEHDVAKLDPSWRLVAVGLDGECIACLATAKSEVLFQSAPTDTLGGARWQAARYELNSAHIDPGLPFLPELPYTALLLGAVDHDRADAVSSFAWMPTDGQAPPA